MVGQSASSSDIHRSREYLQFELMPEAGSVFFCALNPRP